MRLIHTWPPQGGCETDRRVSRPAHESPVYTEYFERPENPGPCLQYATYFFLNNLKIILFLHGFDFEK